MSLSGDLEDNGMIKIEVEFDARGKQKKVSARIDTGSPFSLISQATAKDLKLEAKGDFPLVTIIGGGRIEPTYYVHTVIDNLFDSYHMFVQNPLGVNVIGCDIIRRWNLYYYGVDETFTIQIP